MIYFLIIGVFTILIISYLLNKKFLFAPSLICILSFLIGLTFLSINLDKWHVELQFETVFIILLGLISLIIGERLGSEKISFSKNYIFNKYFYKIHKFKINQWITILLIIVNSLSTYLFYNEVMRISSLYTTSSINDFSDVMANYRVAMMFGDDVSYNVNAYVSQLVKIVYTSSYIYLFIFIMNIFKKIRFGENLINLVVVLPYLILTFLTGGRIGFIKILAAVLWFIYIASFLNLPKGAFQRFISKFTKYIIIVIGAILFLFYSLRVAMGRANSTDTNFTDYISLYIGAPILLLDNYISDHDSNKSFDIYHSETFIGVSVFLNKLQGKKINAGLEFRDGPGGINLGNVYTPFRRYYNDFGYLGVILLPLIMGYILAKILAIIFYWRNILFTRRISFFVILFAYLYNALPTYAAEDIFYLRLSIGFIEELALLYFMSMFLLKIQYANR